MIVVYVVAFQVYALFRTYSPFFCEIAARRMSVVCVDGVVCQLIARAIREYFITSFMSSNYPVIPTVLSQPRWLSGMRRSHVHSLMIARRSLCPEKLGSDPGQGSKGIKFSGWHGLDMSITATKKR